MNPMPKSVTLIRSESMLVIEWGNGHQGQYPLAGLGAVCQCAVCRQKGNEDNRAGSSNSPELPVQEVSVDIRTIERVGNYAVRLIWDDGHAYGICSWDYLYALSPGESAKDEQQ